MKTLITTLILFGSFLLISAEKQEGSDEKEEKIKKAPLKFDVRVKFPLRIKHSYRFDETTDVTRIYEDGTEYKYQRNYTFWVTFWAKAKPENGLQEIWTIVDSLDYYFKDDTREVSYTNLQDEAPPTHRADFNRVFIPNGLEFSMIYDSYGVVGNMEGGNRKEQIEYINHPKYGFQNNDYGLQLFSNRYSMQDLKHIVDPTKGLLPPQAVAKDSTWEVDFNFDVNLATFGGVVKPKLDRVISNSYYINLEMDSLTLKDEYYDLHDQKILADIDSSRVDGKLNMKITSPGHIDYVQSRQEGWVAGSARNRKFREEIKTTQKWERMGMWRL